MSFQHRLFLKLTTFANKINYSLIAPLELKSWLTQNKNETKYNLRPTTLLFIQPNATKTNFGDYTFKNFFAHLFNKLDMLRQNFINNSNFIIYKKRDFQTF